MRYTDRGFVGALRVALVGMLLMAMRPGFGQVSPDEILNPRAKAAEEEFLPQLQSLQQSIAAARFPFHFALARYLHAKPGQRAALDANGMEFVYFQDRVVLKISGVYKAAFNATQLSRNERAGRTFQEAVVPILQLVAQKIPKSADYDAIGFEVIYDTRDADKSYEFEGKEVLTLVLSRDDAFTYAGTPGVAERQKLLNRSDIFVNGEEFGLALGKREPFNVEALDRSVRRPAEERTSAAQPSIEHVDAVSGASVSPAVSITQPTAVVPSIRTFADAMRLQTESQAQLNAIVREDGTRLHLAENPAPSFEVAGDQTVLHFTLRNTLSFDRSSTSIYKRAAQSFDLFLAPELRSLSRRLPAHEDYDALEFSVLIPFGVDPASLETIDYICPLPSLQAFIANKITSQDLINQSVVLVNGVRISVNLQLVE